MVRPNNLTAGAVAVVNLVAAAGWITTRFVGISWIDGLQQVEDPGLADTIAAILAGVAVVGAASHFGTRDESRPARALPLTAMAAVAAALTIPAVVDATSHEHSHATATVDHDHAAGTGDDTAVATDDTHTHGGDETATTGDASHVDTGDVATHRGHDVASPAGIRRKPIDFSGVAGVTPGAAGPGRATGA